jgi:hypothetical protein
LNILPTSLTDSTVASIPSTVMAYIQRITDKYIWLYNYSVMNCIKHLLTYILIPTFFAYLIYKITR